MATQSVDRLGTLPHQKIPSSEYNGIGLRCFAFHRHKAHRRPLRCLADCLGVRGIVLLSLYKRLHVSRRDQADHMAKLADRTVLYLGEINDTQELAWRRSIEVLEDGAARPR